MRWHAQSSQAAAERLGVDPGLGLGPGEAAQRIETHGRNRIQESGRRTLAQMFIGQFADFMILVLLAAALVSGLVGEPGDTIAILVIVVLNAVIGVVQEYRAERAIAALKLMAAPDARVLRAGRVIGIAATEVVPGDVVLLEAGNVVPADLRLFETAELQVDESVLTGESAPVEKHSADLADETLPLGDLRNLAFKGTVVTRG
ncbi:MAG: HAD-IC family P-type ATPase, partial [Pseudomonadota bacterium]